MLHIKYIGEGTYATVYRQTEAKSAGPVYKYEFTPGLKDIEPDKALLMELSSTFFKDKYVFLEVAENKNGDSVIQERDFNTPEPGRR